jgi:hypothetical protein
VPNVTKIRGLNLPDTPLGPCGLWPLPFTLYTVICGSECIFNAFLTEAIYWDVWRASCPDRFFYGDRPPPPPPPRGGGTECGFLDCQAGCLAAQLTRLPDVFMRSLKGGKHFLSNLELCFSTFVRPRPGKFFFYKTRARSQEIIGLQAIFMTGHKQRYCLSRMLKRFRCLKIPDHSWILPCLKIRGSVTDICNTCYLGVLGLGFSTHSRTLFSSEYFHYKIFIHEKFLENQNDKFSRPGGSETLMQKMGIRTVCGKEPHRLLRAGSRPTSGRIAVCGQLLCNSYSTYAIYVAA